MKQSKIITYVTYIFLDCVILFKLKKKGIFRGSNYLIKFFEEKDMPTVTKKDIHI